MTHRTLPGALACSVALTLLATGCGSSGSTDDTIECVTALRLDLEVADGTVIEEVEYEITGNGMQPMGGVINTSAPGSTASVEQFGIPPGDGYTVTMVATSVDGSITCGGASTFDVGAGVSTEVDVLLNCKLSPQFGGVRVNGKLNACAELEKVIVAPLQTATGFALDVSAIGSDAEGDDFAYSWTASSGSFEDPAAPQTIYTCEGVAPAELRVEVSDDDFDYCIDGWTVPVDCVDGGGTGGTGGVGGGSGGVGGTGGGTGGSSGSGGTAGSAGTGGVGGSGGGAGGAAGTAGAGGSAGSAGGPGDGGSGGSAGSNGSIPPACIVTLSVR